MTADEAMGRRDLAFPKAVAVRHLVTFVVGVQDAGKIAHIAQFDLRLSGRRRCRCPFEYRAAAHEAVTTGLGIALR